jgi:double-stranded uracil-DNA glycosylase
MAVLLKSFPPLANKNSRILILGSMPGPVALKKKEYYGFPGNHFWRIMADLFEVKGPMSYKEKKGLLKTEHIALWDTIHSCTRAGASDSSIRCVVPNEIEKLLKKYPSIHTIFLNGKTSETLFRRYFGKKVRLPAHYLPSTSPAHAALSYEKKLEKWRVIKQYLANRHPWC